MFSEQGFQEATITSTNIFMAKASMVGVSFKDITQNFNTREKKSSKLLQELDYWFRKYQHHGDYIVNQVLLSVDEEEKCKVKKPKGVIWPKNPVQKL